MNVLIIGGAGMVGRKLAQRLATDGTLAGNEVSSLTLFDVVDAAAAEAAFPVSVLTGDLSQQEQAEALIVSRPDVIFHLAAVVSGEAEADFEKGYRINLAGHRIDHRNNITTGIQQILRHFQSDIGTKFHYFHYFFGSFKQFHKNVGSHQVKRQCKWPGYQAI